MEAKKCATCGLVNPSDLVACRRCGAYLQNLGPATPGEPPSTVFQDEAPAGAKRSGSDYINKHIGRSIRNLLIVNLVIAVGVITLGVVNTRYLYNIAAGPFRIDRQTLEHTRDPDSLNRYYCTIQGDRVI